MPIWLCSGANIKTGQLYTALWFEMKHTRGALHMTFILKHSDINDIVCRIFVQHWYIYPMYEQLCLTCQTVYTRSSSREYLYLWKSRLNTQKLLLNSQAYSSARYVKRHTWVNCAGVNNWLHVLISVDGSHCKVTLVSNTDPKHRETFNITDVITLDAAFHPTHAKSLWVWVHAYIF